MHKVGFPWQSLPVSSKDIWHQRSLFASVHFPQQPSPLKGKCGYVSSGTLSGCEGYTKCISLGLTSLLVFHFYICTEKNDHLSQWLKIYSSASSSIIFVRPWLAQHLHHVRCHSAQLRPAVCLGLMTKRYAGLSFEWFHISYFCQSHFLI